MRARVSRGERTLINDLHRGIYLGEMFVMDQGAFEENERMIIKADECNVPRIPLVKMEFKQG